MGERVADGYFSTRPKDLSHKLERLENPGSGTLCKTLEQWEAIRIAKRASPYSHLGID